MRPVIRTLLSPFFAFVPIAFAGAQCVSGPQFVGLQHSTAATSEVRRIVAADVEGDGDQDIVYSSGGLLWLRRNDGLLLLAPSLAAAGLSGIGDFVLEDFDRDHLLDLACATLVAVPVGASSHYEVHVKVWRNVTPAGGTMVFVLAQDMVVSPPALSVPVTSIAAGDVDADGVTDLVVDDGRSVAHVFRGEGAFGVPTGSFLAPTTFSSGIVSGGEMEIADVDGDGALDVAVLSTSILPGILRIFEGEKDSAGRPLGTFGSMHDTPVAHTAHRALRIRDLDGDGAKDVVFGRTDELYALRNVGGFAFAPPLVFVRAFAESPFLGDFDRDGRTDIGVPLSSNALTSPNLAVMRDPLGVNGWTTHWLDTGHPVVGTTIDLDGDQFVDIAVGKLTGKLTTAAGGCSNSGNPGITVTAPNGGEQWLAGTLQQITWTNASPVAAFDVDVSFDGGSTWVRIAEGTTGNAFSWWVTEPVTGAAVVRVKPTDITSFADVSDNPFSISAGVLAAVYRVGAGCGAPRVTYGGATVPRLGTTCTLEVGNATAGQFTAWWLSLPIAPPLPLGAPGCDIHLHPALLSLVGTTTTGSTGRGSVPLSIPFAPVLQGLVVATQATVFVAASPVGMQVTNGVLLTLGQ